MLRPSHYRSPILVLLLLAGVAGVVTLLTHAPEAPRPSVQGPDGDAARAAPDAQPAGLQRVRVPAPAADAGRTLPSAERGAQRAFATILCLDGADLRPQPGIRLYAQERVIAGPSTADGVIRLGGPFPADLTVWGKGWAPVDLKGSALPERVLLESSSASLLLRLDHLEQDQRVHKTLLQPHSPGSVWPGPWTRTFEPLSAWSLLAEEVPPGDYDVYVWVIREGTEPLPMSASKVKLDAGRQTELTLDLSELKPIEDD